MSLKWYYRNNDGDIVEMVNRVQFAGARKEGTDGLVANAEEGSVGRSQIRVDDPDGSFDIRGHRLVYAIETEAEDDDYGGRIGIFYSNVRDVVEGSPFNGIGRIWTIDLDDINTILDRRIMRGSDANRDAETDVERIQWLVGTTEAALIEDTTYLSTDDPVNMSDADYRNRKIREIFDDVAQQSGKNWYLFWLSDGAGGVVTALWYGAGTLETFVSEASISNRAVDIAAGSYAPAAGSKLRIDPTRVYSGVVVEYTGGSVLRERSETADDFTRRDTTSPAPHIKNATRAQERGDRYLESIKTEERVISTSIVVDAADVNVVVQGQYIDARFSWMPGQVFFHAMRALNRTVRPLARGVYELALELSAESVADIIGEEIGGYLCDPLGWIVPTEGVADPNGILHCSTFAPFTGDAFADFGTYVNVYAGCTYTVHVYDVIHGPATSPIYLTLNNASFYQVNLGDDEPGFGVGPPLTEHTGTLAVGPIFPDPAPVIATLGMLPWSGHGIADSEHFTVLTYISGPDPRFVGLPGCPVP